jgi:hypothetical protein
MNRYSRSLFVSLLLILAAAVSSLAQAQSFAALVSPPRFELAAKPGERIRQVLEISHMSNDTGRYRLKTNDWKLDAQAGVTFLDELQDGGCRPWVALERREVNLGPNGKTRFRFEVEVPKDAPAQECRFAIMIEGGDQQVQAGSSVSVPVGGRIGVIVYVSVAGAAPKLSVAQTNVIAQLGKSVPNLLVSNTGSAHGRVTGFLTGTDAKGQKLEFAPSTLPVLPGETRSITLAPTLEGGAEATIQYPVLVKGTLELGSEKLAFEQRFAP